MRTLVLFTALLITPLLSSAHVTVRPGEVGIGAYQTFNVSVPTEKDVPTIGVRLIIPEELASVRPNVKPGWDIEIVKTGEGENERVAELIWTGGSIPADQRDDLFFSARTPVTPTTLEWKAYQTYADGTVVAWDAEGEDGHDSGAEEEDENRGPQSTTMVINDLTAEDSQNNEGDEKVALPPPGPVEPVPLQVAPTDPWTILALILAGAGLALAIRNTLHERQHHHTSGQPS